MNVNLLSRRVLLGLFGTGTAAVATGGQARAPADGVSSTLLAGMVENLVELARRPAFVGATWRLRDDARGGIFTWQAGNFATRVAGDPLQGLYVAHAEVPPRQGVWAREWDGLTGRPEWFGARANRPDFDNQPAIQAALLLCPKVQLGPGDYTVARRIQILRNGTHLRGAGPTQTDQGSNDHATRIVSTSATETILQIGSDSRTRPAELVETVHIEGFTVDRSVNPFTTAAGVAGAVGIAMRWCVNCRAERIFSINSSRGWTFSGSVENYILHCSALREREGSNSANDSFVGFHFEGDAPSGFNGGNASLYLTFCRAFPLTEDRTPALGYSAGIRFDGGWVDLFIKGFECGSGIMYGIHGLGDGYNATGFRTENLMITDCVLDPGAFACIALEGGGRQTAVTIANNYFATVTGTAVFLNQLGGSVTLANNQYIVGKFAATGLSAVQVSNLRSHGNIYTGLRQPIIFDRVANFELRDTINGQARGDHPAITLAGCRNGEIRCIVGGVDRSYLAGVAMKGGANSHIEIGATLLVSSAIAGGATNKILHEGVPVSAVGPFGSDCLASGIMR